MTHRLAEAMLEFIRSLVFRSNIIILIRVFKNNFVNQLICDLRCQLAYGAADLSALLLVLPFVHNLDIISRSACIAAKLE